MIQANELRIGNLVHADLYSNAILIESICSKNEDIFNSTTGEIPSHSIHPIPITEEILLKCGFEKNEQRFESKEALLRISYFDSAWHCSIGDDDFGFLFRTIKSVHQLQNLYFSLTGKEIQL